MEPTDNCTRVTTIRLGNTASGERSRTRAQADECAKTFPRERFWAVAVPGQDPSPGSFAAWLERLKAESDTGTCQWIVEDGRIQSGIAMRYQYNARAGHIGYGIRPSARSRGLATWALRQMLTQARDRNMKRVLLVRAADNAGSAKTIERNGGLLDEIRQTAHGPTRRSWINLEG